MSDDDSSEETKLPEDGEKRTLFVGPAQVPWWKYELASRTEWLLRTGPIYRNRAYIPFYYGIYDWVTDVTIGSRDTEISEE